ncbi:MAG: LytR/AlgR family response regulator transcription factor [Actinomycetota bacterium]
MTGPAGAGPLRVLAADDEPPALEDLAFLLRADPRVGSVVTASSGAAVVRALEGGALDALFLDIRMPGLDGLDVARLLTRFTDPPEVVFVTAYDDHAVDAFELRAVDYVMKPVRAERLAEAVRRVVEARRSTGAPVPEGDDETIPVELGGVTRFVSRSEVRFVEAQGDYARLHTAHGSHLVRVPLATLEERWREAGFLRVHRRHLVALPHIEELRVEAGHATVRVAGQTIDVSRRHLRELRDLLVRRARPGGAPR